MDDKTTALIEKFADKLDTTAEQLWGVLLRQATISGTVDLATCVVMVLAAVVAVRFVKGKTTKPANTENNYYTHAEWENDDAILAWIATTIYLLITGMFLIFSAQGVVAAFLNPEYWALSCILGKA